MEFTLFGQRFYRGLSSDDVDTVLWKKSAAEAHNGKREYFYHPFAELCGVNATVSADFDNGIISGVTIVSGYGNIGIDMTRVLRQILREHFGVNETDISDEEYLSMRDYDYDEFTVNYFITSDGGFYIRAWFKYEIDRNENEPEKEDVAEHIRRVNRVLDNRRRYLSRCAEDDYKRIRVYVGDMADEDVKEAIDLIGTEADFAETEMDGEHKFISIHITELDFRRFNTKLYESTLPDELKKRILKNISFRSDFIIKDGKRKYTGNDWTDTRDHNSAVASQHRQHFYLPEGFKDFRFYNFNLPESELDKIICADSLDYLKTLPDKSVDIILTAPPSGFGYDYNKYDDTVFAEDFLNKMYLIFVECARVLKYGGRLIADIKPMYPEYLPLHYLFGNVFLEEGLFWKGEIIWDNGDLKGRIAKRGSTGKPSFPRLKYTWDYIEVFGKGDMHKYGEKEDIDLTAEEYKEWVYAKWDIPVDENAENYGNGEIFPEEVAERLIKLFSYKGDIVLDPFNGTGTTTAVAKKLDRRYIGIDISGEYCITAQERLEKIRK